MRISDWSSDVCSSDLRAALVDRFADHVDDTAERLWADGHADRRVGVHDLLAADEAVGGVHRDGADGVLAEVLRHLQHQRPALVLKMKCVQDRRQIAVEMHVDAGSQDLRSAEHTSELQSLMRTSYP